MTIMTPKAPQKIVVMEPDGKYYYFTENWRRVGPFETISMAEMDIVRREMFSKEDLYSH